MLNLHGLITASESKGCCTTRSIIVARSRDNFEFSPDGAARLVLDCCNISVMNPRWIFVLLLLLTSIGLAANEKPATRPASPLTDISGGAVDPLHPAKRASVLIFVRTDCPISNSYAPILNGMVKTYADRGVTFFIIYTSRDLSVADARAHLKAFGYTCPAIVDSHHTLVKALGAIATPEAFVITPDGSTAYHGRIDDSFPALGKQRPHPTTHELADAIDAVIAGKAPTVAHTRAVGCAISED